MFHRYIAFRYSTDFEKVHFKYQNIKSSEKNLGFQKRETWISPHPKKGDPGHSDPKKGRSKKCANFHVTKRYDEMHYLKE